jgi:hypothetical protein
MKATEGRKMEAGAMCLRINSVKMDDALMSRGRGLEASSSHRWIRAIDCLLFNNRQISLNQFIT